MINIGTFGTKSSNGTTTRVTTGSGSGGLGTLFNPVYLWGQYFDDSGDVNGDMEVKGDIRVEGDISAYGIEADKMEVLKLEADELEAKNFKADAANITDLEATNLKADKAELLNALIKELSATNLVAENLTVTKGAHFFELIIDKIKAAGGAVLFTPADGFKIDKVEPNHAENEIKLYFRATDGEKKKKNMWKKDDQARCQNFNQAKQGTNYNLDNKYFWTLVKNTNNELNEGNPVEVNLGTEEVPDIQECHYIIISTKAGEFEGLVNPEVDDEIVMLGHRGEDVDRQAAIYIAAYSSIDEDLKAPLFVQYAGINDFNLYSHKFNWFSAGVTGQGAVRGIKPNTISGDVRIGGQSIEDYIDDKTGNVKTYRLMPYTNNIMIDKSGNMSPSSVTVKILYNSNGEITTLDNVPDMMKIDVYGVNEDSTETSEPVLTYSAGNPISIVSSTVRQYSYIYCILKATTNSTIYDRCSISIIEDTSGESLHGGHWEFAYKLGNSKPTKPADGTSIEHLDNGWTSSMPTPNSTYKYVYMSQCFVSGTGVYGTWSDPLQLNGADGKPGEDGRDIEYVYCRTTSDTQISAPSSNNKKDWPNYDGNPNIDHDMSNGNIWYDNPQGVDSTHRYEWISMRTVKGNTFSGYSTPAIWSVFGSKGMDGDGYEYIYKLLTTNTFNGTEPKNISTPASDSIGQTKSDDEFVPEGWSDEPKEISSEERYCFVSTRKKHNGTWGDFSKPTLWARYAEKGSDGGYYALIFKNSETNPGTPASTVTLDNLPTGWSKTATTPDKGKYTWMSQRYVVDGVYQGYWTYPIRITGADGENGKDGNNINFIYKITKENSKPSAPTYSSNATSEYQTNDDYTGASDSGWTKSPTGVDKNNMYEWVATRTKTDGKWGSYTVALWSKWGETGMDGDGVEYIFYLSNSTSAPNNPAPSNWSTNSSYQENDWYPTGWTDDPNAVTASKPYQYVSQRKGHKGSWGKFSDPVLWSIYSNSTSGNNGSDGNDGENAKIDRIIDNGCYAEIKYNTSTKKFTLDYKIDFYIGHYDGGELTLVSNSTTPNYSKYAVKWKWQNGSYNSISLSNLSTSVQHSDTGLNWDKSGTNHRTHMIITLYNSNNKMLDQFIVQVLLKSEATIDIIQGEKAAIISTVTGSVKDELQGDMNDMKNSISQVEQTCDEIKGTVDNLEGQVSTISQKSDEISLTVEDQNDKLLKSGIDIKAGKIQISSANTEIVGDLNVVEANKGFSVWNENKAAQLRTNLLGNLNNYGFDGYVQYVEKPSSYKSKPSGETYTLTIYHSMGSITAGSTVRAYYAILNLWDYYDNKNQFIWIGDANGNGKTISHYEVKAMINNSYSNTTEPLATTTLSKTSTPNQTTRAIISGLSMPEVQYTTNRTQTLYVIYEIKLYFIGEGIKQGAFEYRLDGGYVKEQDGMNFLTPDGAMFSNSYKEFFWSGHYNSFSRSASYNDWSVFIRNKQQNLMVSPLGIFRTKFENTNSDSDFDDVISNKNIWGDISSTTPVYKSSLSSVDTATAQNGCRLIDKYGILICTATSGTCTWKLPDPSTCCGRIIHVKATKGASMKFTCTTSNAFVYDDNSEKMNECNIGGVASLFFCDGEYWIHHNSN